MFTPDADYGQFYGVGCAAHDFNRPPFCKEFSGYDPPSWCTNEWCWVDVDACSPVSGVQRLEYLLQANLLPSEGQLRHSNTHAIGRSPKQAPAVEVPPVPRAVRALHGDPQERGRVARAGGGARTADARGWLRPGSELGQICRSQGYQMGMVCDT